MGLFSALLKSPELLAVLGGAGGGLLTGQEGDDPLRRAAGGALVGGSVGGVSRALRSKMLRPKPTQAEWTEAVKLLRGAVPGISPQQTTQFPPKEFTDQLHNVLDMKTQRLPWSADTIKRTLGLGALGAGAATGVGLGLGTINDSLEREASFDADEDKNALKAMGLLGYSQGRLGVRAFQADNGLEPTGRLNETTLNAIAVAINKRGRDGGDQPPSAPSLRPDRR